MKCASCISVKMQAMSSDFRMENDAMMSHCASEKYSAEFFHMGVIWSVDISSVLSASSGSLDRTLVCIVVIVSNKGNGLSLLLLLEVMGHIISSSIIGLLCSFILTKI